MKPKIYISKQIKNAFLLSVLMLFFYGQLWAQFQQIGDDINGEAAGDKSGYSVRFSADGNIMARGPFALLKGGAKIEISRIEIPRKSLFPANSLFIGSKPIDELRNERT